MRSFKAQPKFDPSATQPQIYSPSRNNYQNRIMNVTETSKNKNRTQQIVLLHEEFEDLKKKIKQVENKNEKIIEKIHRECNFKKKTPQTFDASGEGPIVYYEKKQKSQLSQKSGLSVDDSNKSDQSEYEFRQKKPTVQRNSVQSNKHLPQKNFSQSMQYTRSDVKGDELKKKYSKMSRQEYEEEPDSRELIEDQFQGEDFQMQQSHQTYHHLKEYNHSGKSSGKKSANLSSYPVSQTHMAYSALNHPKTIQQQFRHSEQLFNPTFTPQQPSRISHPSTTNSSLLIYQLQESLKIQKEKTAYLQQQLKGKEFQILSVKKEYNKLMGQFESVEMILEDCLEQFFQNTVKKGFFQIDKTLKKYENRLRNTAIHIKDQYEEVKSSRLIKQHQLRRSNSRSRRDLSPIHNTSIHSVMAPPNQSAKIPRPNSSQGSSVLPSSNGSNTISVPQPQNIQPSQTSLLQQQTQLDKRSRISQQSRKNKEFQEIVEKYEEMINSKRDEISKLEQTKKQVQRRNQLLQKQLQVKQTQVKEFKQRLQQLDKLMSEMQCQGPIHAKAPKKTYRVSSTESNLLQDIDHYSNDHQDQRKYEKMYNEIKKQYLDKNQRLQQVNQQMQAYDQKITDYEFRLKEYEAKIRKLQQSSSSQSIAVSQKSQTLLKKQLEQSIKQHLNQLHQLQITHKDSQILKYKEALSKLEKKLVQKDCECISLSNRVKKLDGANELNLRKIEQYQKLLNHYQLNASVDAGEHWGGGSVLDRSICNEIQGMHQGSTLSTGLDQSGRKSLLRTPGRSNNNAVTIPKGQLQSLETQLKQMSEEILTLTKRLKLSQKASTQKQLQIEKLQQQLQMTKVQLTKHTQINTQLKSRITDLQEEVTEFKMKEFDRSQQQEDDDDNIKHNNDQSQQWSNSHKSQQAQRFQHKPISSHNRPTLHHKRNSDFQPPQNPPQSPNSQSRKPSEDNQSLNHLQQSIRRLEQQLKTLKAKNLQLSAQYNNLKSQHLQLSRSNIAVKKNNEYLQESLADREQKYEKCKREVEEMRVRNAEITEKLHVKDEELLKEKQENCQKINQLQKQWHQFQQEITKNNQPEPLNASHLHESQHLKTSRYNLSQSSLLLSSTIHNKTTHYLQEQNEYLTIKLKQAEATIQIHNLMEQKVLDQYRANVERLKGQVKEKGKEVEQVRKELEVMADAKRRLEVLYESSKNYLAESRVEPGVNRMRRVSEVSVKKSQNIERQSSSKNQPLDLIPQPEGKDLSMQQFPSYNQDANNLSMLSHQNVLNHPPQDEQQRMYPYERIIELQGELKQAKDINKKLQQMEEELFKQIRLKEEDKKDLMRLLDEKSLKIQELEEIVQLKDNNMLGSSHLGSHILASHISSSNYKSSNPKHSAHNLSQRQSMHSHSSLRYSGITHLKAPTLLLNNPLSTNLQVMNASQMGTSERFQIQLSQTGSQMLDKSYVTNISEIFQKEEFPYEKVQLKRKEQIKLFEKTASYIKSLKESINEKNKKIKLLEKKIQSLKSTHHGPISKQLQNKYEISTRANDNAEDVQLEFQSVFKDYQSVQVCFLQHLQLQRKKASHNKRYKNLQHEWKLAIEENNVLFNQVQVLQQELQKAEQQQNTILVMKDLYKDEIKKLLAKNQQQTTYYEDLLAKQKAKLQESQSVHNLETIKQLFLKVIDSIIVMESDKSKKKRQEKKKDLQQFFKIFASLCAVEEVKKTAILEGIKKMTLNIVLPEEGRAASRGKD